MKPALIAVGGERLQPGEVTGWRRGGVGVPEAYLRALQRAGGVEGVLFPGVVEPDEADRRISRFDGVLLIGGGDLHPALYGEEPLPECYGIDEEADLFDMELARSAIRLRRPLLAICRGMQALNVALGGSLDQHITGRDRLLDHGQPGGPRAMHDVRLEAGSLVAKAMGADVVTGQSSHHQAVARLGEGLRSTGASEDGLVEAIEHEDGWVLGVQWHPERTAKDDREQQALFDALVREAAG